MQEQYKELLYPLHPDSAIINILPYLLYHCIVVFLSLTVGGKVEGSDACCMTPKYFSVHFLRQEMLPHSYSKTI